jgi:hypothetical protein
MTKDLKHPQSVETLTQKYDRILTLCATGKKSGVYTQIKCPNSANHKHGDNSLSASLGLHPEGISFKCFTGCQTDDFLKSLGLTYRDLYPDSDRVPSNIYTYHNPDGSYHHDKVKYTLPDGKKTFSQRTIDDKGNFILETKTLDKIPFNYPQLVSAIKEEKIILYCEGEKDCLTAHLLGYEATTMGGAGDWKDEYKAFFKCANVVLIPDKDDPGLKLSARMQESLTEVAKSLKVVVLPEGKDLTEWVEAGNGDFAGLLVGRQELAKYGGLPLPLITAAQDSYTFTWNSIGLVVKIDRLTDDCEGIIRVTDKGKSLYVSKINLLATRSLTELANRLNKNKRLSWDTILSQIAIHCIDKLSSIGNLVNINEEPLTMQTEYLLDPILPLGQPTTMFSAGGKGKSTFCDYIAVLVQFGICSQGNLPFIPRQCNVLYLDWESDAETHKRFITAIKKGLGITDNTRIHYLSMEHPLAQVANSVRDYIRQYDIGFLIIDSQMAATASGTRGLTEAQIAGEYYNILRSFGITSLTIDHVTKQSMNGEGNNAAPYGSVVKYNRSRSQFELNLPEEEEDSDHKEYALVHKKFNLGRRLKPLGIAVDFENENNQLVSITFSSLDIKQNLILSKNVQSMPQRLIDALNSIGHGTAAELAEKIGEPLKMEIVATTLSRGSTGKNPRFIHLKDGGYGLLTTTYQGEF